MFSCFAHRTFNISLCALTTIVVSSSFSVSAESDTNQAKVFKILFTGGPCAGKSTALATTRNFLTNLGYSVYTIEEAATLLNRGNIKWSSDTLPYSQYAITKLQTHFEDLYNDYATSISLSENKTSVILMDRGIMDGLAYIDDEMFLETLSYSDHNIEYFNNTNIPNYNCIYSRYDMVLHLVTAAKGAPQFYRNEEYRHESIRDAIITDDRILSVYNGHNDRRILYNQTTFNDKIKQIITHICDKLNIANIQRTPLKFEINIRDNMDSDSDITDIREIINILFNEINSNIDIYYVEKDFLKQSNNNQNYEFLVKTIKLEMDDIDDMDDVDNRTRTAGIYGAHYTLININEQMGQSINSSKQLDQQRYSDLVKLIDTNNRLKLISLRFEYKNIHYNMDIIQSPISNKGIIILKLFRETTKEYVDENGLPRIVPKCILVQKNVTDNEKFSSVYLAT